MVIYEDTWAQIHFNQAGDLLNLTLEANASAMYADDCHPDPILGNCMLLDAVGTIKIMPSGAEQGIYQPDVTAGVSYGVTPDRRQRLGYAKEYDRPWARTVSVYGRFGTAAAVDYYQVQVAKWTNADLLAWEPTTRTYRRTWRSRPCRGRLCRRFRDPISRRVRCPSTGRQRHSDPTQCPESRCSTKAANASSGISE